MRQKQFQSREAYKIHAMPIAEIKPNPLNPRVITDADFQKLVKSVREDGFMLAIRFLVVDKDNVVMGGNQRLKACIAAGLKDVYVVKAEDLTQEELKEFVVRDNVQAGGWDKNLLQLNYSADDLVEVGMDLAVIAEPPLETIGDTEPTVDDPVIKDRKDVFDNAQIKQIVVYFPADLHAKVTQSLNTIKEHMGVEENPEVLLNLIKFWENDRDRKSRL